jgi:hypothetical protein
MTREDNRAGAWLERFFFFFKPQKNQIHNHTPFFSRPIMKSIVLLVLLAFAAVAVVAQNNQCTSFPSLFSSRAAITILDDDECVNHFYNAYYFYSYNDMFTRIDISTSSGGVSIYSDYTAVRFSLSSLKIWRKIQLSIPILFFCFSSSFTFFFLLLLHKPRINLEPS